MSGLGGGIVIIPVYIALGISVPVAAAAGLLMNIIALTLVSAHNSSHRIVRWKLGTAFLVPALVMTPLGEIASTHVEREFVVLIFIALLIYAFFHVIQKRKATHKERLTGTNSLLIAVPVGLIAGFLSGLTGIGGGLIVLPVLTFMEDDYKKIAGTTAYVALFISVASFISHAGSVLLFSLPIWIVIVAGSTAGGLLGSYLLHILKSTRVSQFTGSVILIITGILIYTLI